MKAKSVTRNRLAFGLTLVLVVGMLCAFGSCRKKEQHKQQGKMVEHDLPQIKDSGELVVLTMYSSTSYFIYRGQDMGFQYELGKQFADSLGLGLKVKTAKNVPELVHMLQSGQGDVIAYNLPVRKEWRDSLAYCGKEHVTRQVLVQQSAGRGTLRDVTQLVGKEVHVKPGKHLERLKNLNQELGGGIRIHVVRGDSITEEDLIAQVAKGTIDYTVADDDVAQLNKTYFTNLNVSLIVSFDQRASWAVRKDCPLLAKAVSRWFASSVTSSAYKASEKRYFESSKTLSYSPILSLREGKISIYDPLFKKYAKDINWDWRLLASLAYTESNFDTTAVSWAGARGLMQLMPSTAKAMGMPEGKETNAEESIKAAVKYIRQTTRSFMTVPEAERINFVLASYNSGVGHVQDAMALAEKYGKDKYVWRDNVEKYILLKSDEEYFSDPVCKFGYFRGIETYNFVRDIMARYERYKEVIKY